MERKGSKSGQNFEKNVNRKWTKNGRKWTENGQNVCK